MIIREEDTKLLHPVLSGSLSLPAVPERNGNQLIGAVLRYAKMVNKDSKELSVRFAPLASVTENTRGLSAFLDHGYPLNIITPRQFTGDPTIRGCTKDERLSVFLSQFGKTAVYKKDDRKEIVVIVSTSDCDKEKWQTQFVACLGKLFEFKSIPKDFWKKIADDDKDAVIRAFDDCCKDIDIRKEQIKSVLNGYADRERMSKIRELNVEIANHKNEISTYIERVQHFSDIVTAKERDLAIYEAAKPEEDKEWVDFFTERDDLTVYSTENGILRYYVTSSIEFYDEKALDLAFKNPKSVINTDSSKRVKELLKLLFVEKKGEYIASGTFHMQGRVVAPKSGVLKDPTAFPHPHIYFHACLGGNRGYISQFAQEGNWQMQIEQTRAAIKNINWGDGVVVRDMVRYLEEHYSDRRGVKYKGKMVTPKEFVEDVKKEAEESKGEENG